ncbi:MAG: trypsin-like peptidase domain-containing protein [Deltaproteobacteria bacterium]
MQFRSLALASLGALLFACQSAAQAMTPSASTAARDGAVAAAATPTPAGSPDFATAAAKILPSVVSIKVQGRVEQSSAEGPEELFRRFPGLGRGFRIPQPGPREGLGSGFVIDSAGLILTNYHVVDGADQIDVTVGTPEGPHRTVSAKVIGKAPDFDVALLRTDQKLDVPALPLGDSDRLRVGEWVMAIGNPFGLSQSMSVGIISGKHREDINPSGNQGVYDFLQTDASINPGNSGGPLVDMNGRVIGMNTAISAQGAGIGFAIPASTLSHIFPSLRDKGELSRSWIGVQIQGLTPELAKSYGLPSTSGALVAEVLPNSPAAKAGIQSGDVLTRFDGKSVESSSTLPVLVSLTESGKSVNVELWRNGRSQSVSVKLEARSGKGASASGAERESGGFGLSLRPFSPGLRQELGVDANSGVLIAEVAPGSPAARAGLRPGDVVTELGGKPMSDPGQLAKALEQLGKGQIARLKVARGDGQLFVALEKS